MMRVSKNRAQSNLRNARQRTPLPFNSRANSINALELPMRNKTSRNNTIKKDFILDCCKFQFSPRKEYESLNDPILSWYFKRPRIQQILSHNLEATKNDRNIQGKNLLSQRNFITPIRTSRKQTTTDNPIIRLYKRKRIILKNGKSKKEISNNIKTLGKPMSQAELERVFSTYKNIINAAKPILYKKLPYS